MFSESRVLELACFSMMNMEPVVELEKGMMCDCGSPLKSKQTHCPRKQTLGMSLEM